MGSHYKPSLDQCQDLNLLSIKICTALDNFVRNTQSQCLLAYDSECDIIRAIWTNRKPLEIIEESCSRLDSAIKSIDSLINYCFKDYEKTGLIKLISSNEIDVEDIYFLNKLKNEATQVKTERDLVLAWMVKDQRGPVEVESKPPEHEEVLHQREKEVKNWNEVEKEVKNWNGVEGWLRKSAIKNKQNRKNGIPKAVIKQILEPSWITPNLHVKVLLFRDKCIEKFNVKQE